MRTLLVCVCILLLASGAIFAQSSKATAAISTITVDKCASDTAKNVPSCDTGWKNVYSAPVSIKTSNSQSLFLDVSMVTGLYTSTSVKGGNNTDPSVVTSTSQAMGTVQVRLVMDPLYDGAGKVIGGTYAYPDAKGSGIVFDQRIQTLTANLGNIFTKCFADAIGGTTTVASCALTPEQLTLELETAGAHSFNFILPNVGVGTHTLLLQAQQLSSASTGGLVAGSAASWAVYGPVSMTVESVRLVHGFEF